MLGLVEVEYGMKGRKDEESGKEKRGLTIELKVYLYINYPKVCGKKKKKKKKSSLLTSPLPSQPKSFTIPITVQALVHTLSGRVFLYSPPQTPSIFYISFVDVPKIQMSFDISAGWSHVSVTSYFPQVFLGIIIIQTNTNTKPPISNTQPNQLHLHTRLPQIIEMVKATVKKNIWKNAVLPNRILFKPPIPNQKVIINMLVFLLLLF